MDASSPILVDETSIRYDGWRIVVVCFLVATFGWGQLEGERITSDVGREADPLRLRSGYYEAGANFFATLGVKLVAGRDFVEGDANAGAAILSQRAASLLFPHGNAVGRMVKLGGERSTRPWIQVIGIAPDIQLGISSRFGGESDTLKRPAAARKSDAVPRKENN